MIDSLVRESRSALRHLRRGGGERDAGIFVGDDGGCGIARGYASLRAGCYVVADA